MDALTFEREQYQALRQLCKASSESGTPVSQGAWQAIDGRRWIRPQLVAEGDALAKEEAVPPPMPADAVIKEEEAPPPMPADAVIKEEEAPPPLPADAVINDPVSAAGKWETLKALLYLHEQRLYNSQQKSSSRDISGAVLYVLLQGRVPITWACERGPMGTIPRGSAPKVRRLALLIAQTPTLLALATLPPDLVEPIDLLSTPDRLNVLWTAQQVAAQIFTFSEQRL